MISKTKIGVIIGIVVVLLGLAYYCRGLFIAAWVNGAPVSRFEVIGRLEKASGKSVLDSLITKKLIEDEAKKKGIAVTKDEIAAEIKKIEDQIAGQGGTLDQALAQQAMTKEDLEIQISVNGLLQKLIADKINVSEEEIQKFIADNKVTIPKGQEQQFHDQVKNQVSQQKISVEAKNLIDSLKGSAKIKYFVNYD